MLGLLKPILVSALTLFLLAWLLPSVTYLDWVTLVLASVVLTVLQKVVRPILGLLFLPINIVTLGFFSLVLNVAMLWLVTYLVPGFQIVPISIGEIQLNYFFTLLLLSFIISFFQSLIGLVL